jgi:hypothetical protein
MVNELIVGGLIHHIIYDTEMPFKATMLRSNVIIKWENRVNLLLGENSMEDGIIGIGYDVPVASHPTLGSINMKVGAYLQDDSKFEDYGIQTPLGCDVMPILGLEFNLPYNDKWGISTLITPAITFTGLRFTF